MFGSAMLKCSEHQRPFWLTVALSVLLLVSVSITIAHAANPARLTSDLRRDLGALRLQLELIDAVDEHGARQTITFNADLGDGSPAFRRDSMVTMAARANRRLERLIESYRLEGSEARARAAATLRLAMYDLRQQIERLARTTGSAEATVVRKEIAAALDRSEHGLSMLLWQPTSPPIPLPNPARAN
jgi:hypothetical protein